MPDIVIPAGHRPILARLLALTAEQRKATLEELSKLPVQPLTALSERLVGPMGMESDVARSTLRMLASMYQAMISNGESPQRFSALVIKAAKALPSELQPKNLEWEEAAHFVEELMKLDGTLGISSKILDVMTDHEHVYYKSRVLTDVRPVFPASATEPPAALTVVHTLRVSYYSSSRKAGDRKAFFVALDSSDLEELREQIDRALTKEETLRALFLSKSLPIVEESEVP